MSIIKDLEALGYDVANVAINDTMLRRLIDSVRVSQTADGKLKGTYFRVLLTWVVDPSGRGGQYTPQQRLDTLHQRMYGLVQEILITPDIQPNAADDTAEKARKYNERQSRVMFAVSAKSTIQRALKAGVVLAADMSKGHVETLIREAVRWGKAAAPDYFTWAMKQLDAIDKHLADMSAEQQSVVEQRAIEVGSGRHRLILQGKAA